MGAGSAAGKGALKLCSPYCLRVVARKYDSTRVENLLILPNAFLPRGQQDNFTFPFCGLYRVTLSVENSIRVTVAGGERGPGGVLAGPRRHSKAALHRAGGRGRRRAPCGKVSYYVGVSLTEERRLRVGQGGVSPAGRSTRQGTRKIQNRSGNTGSLEFQAASFALPNNALLFRKIISP